MLMLFTSSEILVSGGIAGVCFIRILVTYLRQFRQPAQT